MRATLYFILSLCALTALADDAAPAKPNEKGRAAAPAKGAPVVDDVDSPQLSDRDVRALALARKLTVPTTDPVPGPNGRLLFTFGQGQPRVICEPTRTTDIALQPGESIRQDGIHAGDTVQWQIAPAISGAQGNETMHIIVKPIDYELETNLIVATDRRTYNIDLVSLRSGFMPSVGFNYPEDSLAQFKAYEDRQKQVRAANTLPETGEDISKLNFDYLIEGKAEWKPVRVYNNGKKTIVQMPASMKAGEAPALIVMGDDDAQQVVNFRLLGDRYIVDTVFNRAVLVLGVGRHQTKVTITRTN